MTTKLGSLNECRGYLRVVLGREKADAMSGFELAAAVRQHGAELALDVSVPTSPAPARADSVYREDTRATSKLPDRRVDAYAASWRRDGESLSAYVERTRADAVTPPQDAGKLRDKRLDAFNASWGDHATGEEAPR